MLLKRLDKYLLMNNPEIWISKIHWLVVVCLGFLVIEIITGFLLPISINSALVMFFAGGAAIFIMIPWFRSQKKYFEKKLSFSELKNIFLLNSAGFLFLGLVIITIPLVLSFRVNRILNRSDYADDIKNITVAFIPPHQAWIIQRGILDQRIKDSLANSLPIDSFQFYERLYTNLMQNNFITSGIYVGMEGYFPERRMSKYLTETVVDTTSAVQTVTTVDTLTKSTNADTASAVQTVTTVDTLTESTDKKNTRAFAESNYSFISNNDSAFELIRSSNYNYDSIKNLTGRILDKYDLSKGYFDDFNNAGIDLNKFFEDRFLSVDGYELNGYRRKLRNQLSNIRFNKWVLSNGSSEPLVVPTLIILFFFILPILSFILIIDPNSWRAIIVSLIVAGGLLIFFTFLLFYNSSFMGEAPEPYYRFHIYYGLTALFTFLVVRLFRYKYPGAHMWALQMFNYMISSIPLLLIFLAEIVFRYSPTSFIVYLALPAFILMLFINFQFIRQYQLYINEPRE